MTNFIPTDQSRTSCSESSALKEAVCMSDKHCRARPYLPSANGRWTGRCLFPSNNLNQSRPMKGLCEIQGKKHFRFEVIPVCMYVCRAFSFVLLRFDKYLIALLYYKLRFVMQRTSTKEKVRQNLIINNK